MNNNVLSIRKELHVNSLKEAFIQQLTIAADLVDKRLCGADADVADAVNEDLRAIWIENCWDDYGNDIVAYLSGTNNAEMEELILTTDDDYIDYCSVQDLCDAIKANSESFFGYDITKYLEH